jgi:hypothetical protein
VSVDSPPPAQPPAQPPPQQPPPAPPTPPAADAPAVPTTSPGIGSTQILISPSSSTFRVGGGPYTVPLLIADASHLDGA